MRIYDSAGNVIEVQDRYGEVLNERMSTARIIEKRNGQFRMTPTLYWSAWGGVIAGYSLSVLLFGLSMVFWALGGTIHSTSSQPWAAGIGGLILLVLTAGGNFVLVDYYKRHGQPHRAQTDDKPMYCKKCQGEIEAELDLAKAERAAEALETLQQLTGEKYIPVTRELE